MPAKGYRKPKVGCSIGGCGRWAEKRGWCNTHYQCWRLTGNPIPQLRPTYGAKRRPTTQGYIEIYEPTHPLAYKDGYVLEHRKIAWDAGLLTDPSLLVHHHDEDRQNNDLGNLRVKTNPDHAREHVHRRGYVTNQHGTWPLKVDRQYAC